MKPILKSKNKILGNSLFLASFLLITNASNAAEFVFNPLPPERQLVRPGVGFQEPNRALPTGPQLDFCIANGFTPGSAQSNSVGEVFNNRKKLEDAGIKTGSTYLRINWQQIEPNNNDWQFDRIHKFLECANKRGHAVDFRVMLTDPSNPKNTQKGLPDWVNNLMANEAPNLRYWSDFSNGFSYPVPNFNNPALKREHNELIRRLGAEFDGHKDLNSIDIGSIGYWGEWHYLVGHDTDHKDFMPSYTTQKEIINLYVNSFKSTPKVALHGAHYDSVGQRVSVPPYSSIVASHLNSIRPKLGWRGDSWGSWGAPKPGGGFKTNFNSRYNDFVFNSGGHFDNWETGMVALEIQYNNMNSFNDYSLTKGNYSGSTQKAKEWHVSTINSKQGEFPIAGGVRERSLDLSAKMGYRHFLRKGNYSSTVAAGDPLTVNMTWQNQGIAPLYRNFVIAFRLRDATGKIVFATKTGKSLKGKLPGWFDTNPKMYIHSKVQTGTYFLDTAIVFDGDRYNDDYSSRIPIAISESGRIKNKWVQLGNVNVTGGGTGVGFVPNTVGGSTGGGTGTGGTSPVANVDNVFAESGVKKSFYPLVNDIGDNRVLNQPNAWSQKGGVVKLINNNQITYQSKTGFTGVDKIWYVMRDSQGRTNSSVINITVSGTPFPVARADNYTTARNTGKVLNILDNDTPSVGIAIDTLYQYTTKGGWTSKTTNGKVWYKPKTGFTGQDNFWYVMIDAQGRKSSAQVKINVN